LARIGVRKIAASVLFLRPAVIGSLRRHIKDKLAQVTLLREKIQGFRRVR